MKTYEETDTHKLVDGFDEELRALLINDLKAIKAAKHNLMANIELNQDSLTAV